LNVILERTRAPDLLHPNGCETDFNTAASMDSARRAHTTQHSLPPTKPSHHPSPHDARHSSSNRSRLGSNTRQPTAPADAPPRASAPHDPCNISARSYQPRNRAAPPKIDNQSRMPPAEHIKIASSTQPTSTIPKDQARKSNHYNPALTNPRSADLDHTPPAA
jgi:hypothetical protein